MAKVDDLKEEAHKIEEEVADTSVTEIPLDQPFPEEIAEGDGPIAEIAAKEIEQHPPAGPTPEKPAAADSTEPPAEGPGKTQPTDSEEKSASTSADAKPEGDAASEPSKAPETPPAESVPEPTDTKEPEDEGKEPAKVAGYTAGDLVQAVVKPPQPEVNDTKQATKRPKVKFLVGVGAALLVIGIVLFLILDPAFGLVVAILGALLALAAVFLPLHKIGKKPKKTEEPKSEAAKTETPQPGAANDQPK